MHILGQTALPVVVHHGVGIDLAHVLIPFILHHTTDFRECGQQELGLVDAAYACHSFGDANEGVGHAVDIAILFHRAELVDIHLHQANLLVDGAPVLIGRRVQAFCVLVRPTDEHGIRILKRRALPCGRNAVLDLHQEHVADDAQPFRGDFHDTARITHPFLHSVHARTCPLP